MIDALTLAEIVPQHVGTFTLAGVVALATLAALEVVLGIDNVVFISVETGKLPEHQQGKARTLGLLLAMVLRLGLLAVAWLVVQLERPVFELPLLKETVHDAATGEAVRHAIGISWKDLVLLAGGLFLIAKAVTHIHHLVDGDAHDEGHAARGHASFAGVIGQILVLDLVFSLDSVITAVGMTDNYWIMAGAVVIAVGVMLFFAGPIGRFVNAHPSMKTLALAFLVMIGVLLVAEGLHQHFDRGYVYFAMVFALIVEVINLKAGARRRAKGEPA
ncbi:MAG: TerC family protein [Phycisphaerales bacterium]